MTKAGLSVTLDAGQHCGDQARAVQEEHEYPAAGYAWFVVFLLFCAYILSYLDRQLLALLVEPIKQDLDLSDTQMGLLLGPAFALFYATMGLPLGWLADRYSRRTIVGIGITVWCAATAAAGLARSYMHLFVTRVLVGVGEASLSPCALSLITDYFPPNRRSRAIAFYTGAVSIGAGIAYLIGGKIIQWARPMEMPIVGMVNPWQVVFLVVGLPGLLIALLMSTVREPKRTGTAATAEITGEQAGLPTTFRYLLRRWRSFGSIFGCMSLITVLAYTHFWMPAFFSRTWEWDIPKFGFYNGVALLILGPTSVNTGGWIADWLTNRGRPDGPVIVLLSGTLIMLASSVAFPIMPTDLSSFGVYLFTIIGAAIATATAPAAIVSIAPGQIRSQTIALFYLTISLIGAGLGPPSVAFFTDYVFGDEAAINYSLALVPVVFGVLGLFPMLMIRNAFARELADRQAVMAAAT
jgi:MFS family permease